MGDLQPNSHIVPTFYIDQLLWAMEGEEVFVMAIYFRKALHGYGVVTLSASWIAEQRAVPVEEVETAIANLVTFGVLVPLDGSILPNSYALQTDANRIDWAGLEKRHNRLNK